MSMEKSNSKDNLEHTLKTMILFIWAEKQGYVSDIGCEEMMAMVMVQLCEHIGDARYCEWLKHTRENDNE